jgi:hypothetical protein
VIIKHYLETRYPVLKLNQVIYKLGKVPDTDYHDSQSVHLRTGQKQIAPAQFNVMFFGAKCPISACCGMPLCLTLCGLTATFKLNCMSGKQIGHFNPQI